ncbi:MAG: flagellar brake protein [Methylococcaceae bacterium]
MSDISSFSVQNPKQILSYLLLLIKSESLLNVSFGADNESYVTPLLSINEKDKTVILDCSYKQALNQHILMASQISFQTEYNGIEVYFVGTALKKITYKGGVAFSMPIPKLLYWMERREYYRVKASLSKASYCQLMLDDGKTVNLKLYDISLTGFAILNVSKEISELLTTGTLIEQCKLILSGIGESTISFEVRYTYITKSDKFQKIQKVQKIGCKYINATRSAEDIIQRYMQQVQREELQKE